MVEELSAVLAARGVSIAELARRVGVSQPYVSRLIRQERYKGPSGELAGQIAEALGLPADHWPEYRAAKVIDRLVADGAYRDRLYDALE